MCSINFHDIVAFLFQILGNNEVFGFFFKLMQSIALPLGLLGLLCSLTVNWSSLWLKEAVLPPSSSFLYAGMCLCPHGKLDKETNPVKKIPQPVSYDLTWIGSTIFAKQHKNEKMVRGGNTTSVKLLWDWGVNLLSVMPYLCLEFSLKKRRKKPKKRIKTKPHYLPGFSHIFLTIFLLCGQ